MISILEGVFLFTVALNLCVPGRWASKWYIELLRPWSSTFFNLHGPACGLVLYFASGDNQWKYVPASILFCLLYDFGFIWSADWFTALNTIFVGFHHLGPIVAFYFQSPEHAWLNALLYFQVWYIHGFGFLRQTIMPFLGLGEVEKNSSFDYWLHMIYAAMTPLAYALNVQYLPFGWNYSTLAIFLQTFGRYCCAQNICNYTWMRYVECPGLIAVASYSYGGVKVVVPMLLIYVTTVYFFIEKANASAGCTKLVLTDEIREFMKAFPDEEPITEEKKQESIKWFDSQSWAEQYPLFRAVMLRENDKVAQMLKEGADHTRVLTTWFNTVPMQWAASGGGVSTMKVLIEAGANPFHKGVRDGTYYMNQEYSRKFYDELQALAKKDEDFVSSVNAELLESPVDFNAAQALAKSKGGRLVTPQEAELLFTHRAAEESSEDAGEVEDVSCFATNDTLTSTFACKVTKSESPVIISGVSCSQPLKSSLLLWIEQKEQAESDNTEAKDTEAKMAA